jgi:hypothetical protein
VDEETEEGAVVLAASWADGREEAAIEPAAIELAEVATSELTDDELDVLTRLGATYHAFAALPRAHPSDHDDVVFHVHAIGRIVMARAAVRAHPDRWRFK